MGITLDQLRRKGRSPLVSLESPLLLALLLSIGIHVLIWKILPDMQPLRKGHSQGWLKVFIMEGKTNLAAQSDSSNDESRPDTNSNKPSSATATNAASPPSIASSTSSSANTSEAAASNNSELAQNAEPFFMRGRSSRSIFGSRNDEQRVAQEAMQKPTAKPPDWEVRMRHETLSRRNALYQGIALFQGQKMAQGMPFGCTLLFSEDYTKGFVSCQPESLTDELKFYVNSARILWQSQKNGLPLEQQIGQPTSQIKAE